uniref:Uncharacterized protein n=1 Tax=Anguilla anguilla TaxID=7936 RepID=A0A0E9VBX7_ANGAN
MLSGICYSTAQPAQCSNKLAGYYAMYHCLK